MSAFRTFASTLATHLATIVSATAFAASVGACGTDAPGPGVTASTGPYFSEAMFFNQDVSGEAKAANSDQIIGSLREVNAALDIAGARRWLAEPLPMAAERDRLGALIFGLIRGRPR